MNNHFINKRFKALALTEVLFVSVIIGILVPLALPNLLLLITKAKITEAKNSITARADFAEN